MLDYVDKDFSIWVSLTVSEQALGTIIWCDADSSFQSKWDDWDDLVLL